jgi:hypothetical protein
VSLQELNGVVYQVTQKTITNKLTGESTQSLSTEKVEGMDTMTPAKEREIVKGLNTSFNLLTDTRIQFTPRAYAAYIKAADDALGNDKSLGSDLNLTDHKKVIDVYTKFAIDENNLKDKFKSDVFLASVAALGGTDMAAVAASIAIQENPDSPEAKEAVNQFIASMAAYYDAASHDFRNSC